MRFWQLVIHFYCPFFVAVCLSLGQVTVAFGQVSCRQAHQFSPSNKGLLITDKLREMIPATSSERKSLHAVELEKRLLRAGKGILDLNRIAYVPKIMSVATPSSNIGPIKYFEILPGTQHALSRLARDLQTIHNTTLIFCPSLLEFLGVDAGEFHGHYDDGTPFRFLLIGTVSLLSNEKSLYRDRIIHHELRHVLFRTDLLNNKPSPYYGELHATEGKILDDMNPQSLPSYSKTITFEEMKTYRDQCLNSIFRLKAFLKNSASEEQIQSEIREVWHAISTLYILSYRSAYNLHKIDSYLRKPSNKILSFFRPNKPNYSLEDGIVFATLDKMKIGESELRLKLPLVHSIDSKDPNNMDLFWQQLAWTFSAAKETTEHAAEMYRLFSLAQSRTVISKKDILETAERTQELLVALKRIEKEIESLVKKDST